MTKASKSKRSAAVAGPSFDIGGALMRQWDKLMAGRAPRERKLLGWGGVVSLVLVLIFGLWMPMQESRARLSRSVATERKHLAVMDAARKEIQRQGSVAAMQLSGVALRGVIEGSAKTQLAPAAVEVRLDGESSIVVKFSKARMSKLAPWIESTVQGQRVRLDTVMLRPDDNRVAGELRFVIPES